VKPDGQVFCAARPSATLPVGTDPRDIARTIESGSPTLGRYGFRPRPGAPRSPLSAPAVERAGVVRAVIVVALDLGQLARTVLETPLPTGASMLLATPRGHPRPRPGARGVDGEMGPTSRYAACWPSGPAGMQEGVGLGRLPMLLSWSRCSATTGRAWDARW